MTGPIHIVEPTLASDAGHCHTFVESLCRAGGDPRAFRVWCAAGAALPTLEGMGVPLERRFHRRVRRLEQWALYRSLLRQDGRVLVSTAGHTDLLLLDWAARGRIPPRKAYAYFHWVRPSPRKLASFRRLARRQPELVVLGPTKTVVDVFAEAGFPHTAVVPYPASQPDGPGEPESFRHLLFAGAAREDKGFSHVVGLVERLAGVRPDVRVVLQTSVERNDRRDDATRSALARLSAVRHPSLELRGDALDPGSYAELFRGAICLQPYDPREFADRVSGVTLDAMAAGAPVVTIPGSWIARVVARFGAGEVAASAAPGDLLSAVERVHASYRTYGYAALEAGRALRGEHDARLLLEAIRS